MSILATQHYQLLRVQVQVVEKVNMQEYGNDTHQLIVLSCSPAHATLKSAVFCKNQLNKLHQVNPRLKSSFF